MSAYQPSSWSSVAGVAASIAGAAVAGFVITRGAGRARRLAAWLLVVAGLVAVERMCRHEPPGFRMLALVGYGLIAMKGVVAVEAVSAGAAPLPLGRWLGFAGGWIGMEPRPFSRPRVPDLAGARELVARGSLCLLAGAALVASASPLWDAFRSRLLATAVLLPGLSIALHFGLLEVLAGAWRAAGVDCRPVFRSPAQSTSLGEFWSRRWNLAFSQMTSRAVFRPVARRAGRPAALLASFALSGALHEMAISLPVRAGFGLPLLYFLIQGSAVLIEDALERRGRQPHGWRGRMWTFVWLVAPLPLLFHAPFLRGVIWPLAGIGEP